MYTNQELTAALDQLLAAFFSKAGNYSSSVKDLMQFTASLPPQTLELAGNVKLNKSPAVNMSVEEIETLLKQGKQTHITTNGIASVVADLTATPTTDLTALLEDCILHTKSVHDSSNVWEIAYSKKRKQLLVKFDNGSVYSYSGVPINAVADLAVALVRNDGPRPGVILNTRIKAMGYPYRKVS